MVPVKTAEYVNRQEVTAEHKASVQCAVSVRGQSTVQSIHRGSLYPATTTAVTPD